MSRTKLAALVRGVAAHDLDIIIMDAEFTQAEFEEMLKERGVEVIVCSTMAHLESQLSRVMEHIKQNTPPKPKAPVMRGNDVDRSGRPHC